MATSVSSFFERRVDSDALPLAVGDVVVLAVLLTLGVVQHNGVSYLQTDPVGWILTLVPFFVGWAIFAPVVGAYSAGAAESAKSAVPLAIRSWIPAAIAGALIRATPLFEGGAAPIFVAVVTVVGLVGLSVWRWAYFKIR